MASFKISTRSDLKTDGSASFGEAKISTSQAFGDVTVGVTCKPSLFSVSKGGLDTSKLGIGRVDATVEYNDVTAYFDNVQKGNAEIPRIGYKTKLEAGGNTYALEASYAHKGNAAKLACTMPKFEGVGCKVEYATADSKTTINLDKTVADTKCKLKLDAKSGAISFKATASRSVAAGVTATVDISDKEAGTISLSKDQFALDVPYSVKGGVDTSGATLKMKWSTTIDI